MQQKPTIQRDGPSDDRATRISGRDRGVSEIIGAILLFGLLILVLTLVQANAVPDANKQLEFQHNERVQGDFVDLDADLEATAATGNGRATVVETGLRYPPRFFLFNPPPAEGAVRTGDSAFTVRNAVAQGNDETADYWNGDAALADSGDRFVYESRTLSYAPSYNVYAGAPTTTYTHGVVVNRFEDGTVLPVDDAAFVNGRTISLVALDGDRDVSQVDPLSLEAAPLATDTRTVRVTNTTDSPIVIRIQTTLSASEWDELLSEEPNVVDVTDGPGNTVDVELRTGVTYDLQLAKLGVGPGTVDPDPTYLTSLRDTDILADRTQSLTVEVRNEFNGPEANVPVTFDTPTGTTTVTTNDRGQATLEYNPSAVGDTVTARADLDSDPGNVASYEEVVFTVTASGSAGDVGSELNPVTDGKLRFESASAVGSGNTNTVQVNFSNPGNSTVEIEDMRINFYFTSAQGEQPGAEYFNITEIDGSPQTPPITLDVRGGFTAASWTIDAGEPQAKIVFELYETDETGSPVWTEFATQNQDRGFFVITFQHPDGSISSYIVNPAAGNT